MKKSAGTNNPTADADRLTYRPIGCFLLPQERSFSKVSSITIQYFVVVRSKCIQRLEQLKFEPSHMKTYQSLFICIDRPKITVSEMRQNVTVYA